MVIQLTGPDSQAIYVNTLEIVTLRRPRGNEHFGKGVQCLIHTVDGKYVAVIEACQDVLQRMRDQHARSGA